MLTLPVYSASDVPVDPEGGAVVPFRICGADRQYLAFQMSSDDVVFAEPTAFVAATGTVSVSAQVMTRAAESLLGRLLAPLRLFGQAFGRIASGESLFSQVVRAEEDVELILGNPKGGQIVALPLTGEPVTIVRGGWVGHTGNVAVGLAGPPTWGTGILNRAGYWWQTAKGDGDVFFAARGHAVVRALDPGVLLTVDPRSLLAWTGSPRWRTVFARPSATWFGGEDFTFLTVEGPCTVVVDTEPGRHRPPEDTPRPSRSTPQAAAGVDG